MARASLDMIAAMRDIAEEVRPVTGRGIGYKLFTRGLITSMSTNNMQKVYRLLRVAREQGTIPWDWIVDETRELERVSAWSNPAEYARTVACSYRRDFWDQQPCRVEVWSEKGTVRGVLKPVLDQYAVDSEFNMVSVARLPCITLPTTLMEGRLLFSTSATSTLRACTCRSTTCRSGCESMAATMSGSGALP
ncbi:hypothetical protein ACQ5SK_00260 [Bradyrhizobium japonicum]